MKNCPRCKSVPYLCNTGAKYRCSECGYQYTDKSGTIFQRSKLPLEKIARLLDSVKQGKNALEISKELPVQYKTAWNLVRMVNKTPQHIVDEIHRLAKDGYSTTAIEFQTGVSKGTVAKIALDIPDYDACSNDAAHKCKLKKKKYLDCGYCEESFMDCNGEKTSDLKTGRIKRAFCSHRCAMNYRSRERHDEKCSRCNKSRRELSKFLKITSEYQATGVCFTKGYCPRCYGLLQQFNFVDELATSHELNQTLKMETKNGIEHQKHGRPSQSYSGCDRRSTQGKSRPAAGKGDFGSFFADFAIRPTRL